MSKSKAFNVDVHTELGALLERTRKLASVITAGVDPAGHSPTDHQDQLLFVGDRLKRSVIRPMKEAFECAVEQHSTQSAQSAPDDEHAADEKATVVVERISAAGEALLGLAQDATGLRVLAGVPELQEAAAALQDLACRWAADEGENEAAARLAGFREIMASVPRGIQSETDGPYLVTNAENVTDWLGCALPAAPQMALCRCGQSKLKPLCDGTHAEIGFKDEKDPLGDLRGRAREPLWITLIERGWFLPPLAPSGLGDHHQPPKPNPTARPSLRTNVDRCAPGRHIRA